jgi:AraC family transcriptional regulator of adaptative response/methylated-DNA-[protein]-cysteine methyltransferase
MSPFHLQRIFKRTLGVSPRAYADALRFRSFKHHLKQEPSATAAVYAAGYGSSSRAYERAASRLGMTPTRYRQGGKLTRIHYLTAKSALGLILVAATEKGICFVSFGDNKTFLERSLREEFPAADIQHGSPKLQTWLHAILRHLKGHQRRLDLPLDMQGTAFQSRVWTALRSIPYGQTRSYTQIAKAIGKPAAVRAVARACASNPVSVIVPCHRVVSKNGNLAGYRWGLKRKCHLLAKEASRQV